MLNTSSGIVLPHLWQKPAFDDLLECLRKLRVEQPVWSLKVSRDEILKQQNEAFAAHDRREIVSFLSMIIKSNLGWIDGDEEREEIWDEASKRLSERCGRAGTYPVLAPMDVRNLHHTQIEVYLEMESRLMMTGIANSSYGRDYSKVAV